MTELYAALYTLLANDGTLTSLLSHTNSDRRIRRGWQPALADRPCVTYDEWSDILVPVDQEKGNRQPHEITLRFSIWSPQTVPAGQTVGADLLVGEIKAALIDALHGADLGTADLHSYSCRYDDFSTPIAFDDDLKCWMQVLRFRCTVKAI